MVKALLSGAKVQTRRIMNPQPVPDWSPHSWGEVHRLENGHPVEPRFKKDTLGWGVSNWDGTDAYCCPMRVGEVVIVKESWAVSACYNHAQPSELQPCNGPITYKADSIAVEDLGRLRPSIFMCEWMSRIHLRIDSIRCERVSQISEEDAKAEGPDAFLAAEGLCTENPRKYLMHPTAWRDAFAKLWTSIHGPESWEKDWVWVYNFTRVKP